MRKVHRFFQLSWMEQIYFLEAWFLSVFFRLSLLLRYKPALLGLPMAESFRGYAHQFSVINTITKTFCRVEVLLPKKQRCLCMALAARYMLRRRQLHSTLYLGLKKDSFDGLKAHAWLRSGSYIVTGEKGMGDYQVVASFI